MATLISEQINTTDELDSEREDNVRLGTVSAEVANELLGKAGIRLPSGGPNPYVVPRELQELLGWGNDFTWDRSEAVTAAVVAIAAGLGR